jgi:glycine/D-amino acid oxidase-like deaminating enzyme
LRAMQQAFLAHGGVYLPRNEVKAIRPRTDGFDIDTTNGLLQSERVVLAAGLDNARLAPMVGMHAPITPLRGQIMVTERLAPFLDYPTLVVRQTPEGSVLLGDSAENVGFDDGQSRAVMADIARRARTAFPVLAHTRIVRAWGALRIMTPDGLPVYEQSQAHPGAFLAICHSGVTLAAAHADVIAPWIAGGAQPALLHPFVASRFSTSTDAAHHV